VAFTMQCNSEKFQPGQIEILTENREGINATLKVCYCNHRFSPMEQLYYFIFIVF